VSTMSAPADQRRNSLLQALQRVKSGLKAGESLSILKVAEEAGVSGSLIHNRYPDIAERIRGEMGKSSRVQRDQTRAALTKARQTIADLRKGLRAATADVRRLASINLSVTMERDELRAVAAATNITPIKRGERT
jgi:AcrR family transcriptional regulator